MRGSSHRISGLGLGAAVAYAAPGEASAYIAGAAAYFGATAPDWMERPTWKEEGSWFTGGKRRVRKSLVEHRKWTHWAAPWAAALVVGVVMGMPPIWGFALGGLLHVFLDAMTPMGVPVLVPSRRRSLRLVTGTGTELSWLALTLCLIAASAYVLGAGLPGT